MSVVPTFALYGEAQAEVGSEFIHIEEIAARSATRNWQIEAHLHRGLFQLLFVFSGSARVLLDDEEHEYQAPMAVVVPPGVIHAFKFMPGTDGYVLTLEPSGLAASGERDSNSGSGNDFSPLLDQLHGQAEVDSLGEPDGPLVQRVRGLLIQIASEFNHPGAASTRMFTWLVQSLILLLVRERLALAHRESGEARHDAVLRRLRELVERHYLEHWPVERYARALNLTEDTLNRLCRRAASCTASTVVRDRLMLEARRRLIFTAMPISQLAYELGFSDPAYFTRFFKKSAGATPKAFRQQQMGDGAS